MAETGAHLLYSVSFACPSCWRGTDMRPTTTWTGCPVNRLVQPSGILSMVEHNCMCIGLCSVATIQADMLNSNKNIASQTQYDLYSVAWECIPFGGGCGLGTNAYYARTITNVIYLEILLLQSNQCLRRLNLTFQVSHTFLILPEIACLKCNFFQCTQGWVCTFVMFQTHRSCQRKSVAK